MIATSISTVIHYQNYKLLAEITVQTAHTLNIASH